MKPQHFLFIALIIFSSLIYSSCQPTDYSGDINALKASRDSLAAALKVTNANLQSTNTTMAGLSASITTIQAQLLVISGQISTLNTQLTATNVTVAGHTTAIATIQSQIKTIQDQIAALNTQQIATKVVVDNLSTTIASIQSQITSLLSQVATLNAKQLNTDATLIDIYNKLAISSSQLASLTLQFNALVIQLSLVEDVDGNKYHTVTIGTQVWMSENLRTTKFSDGTTIPLIINNATWANSTAPAYCWYNNDETTNAAPYGALYNWYAVSTGKLCPTGWHVPSDTDWATLTNYLGGTNVAGGKLKEVGTTHWLSPNAGANNESGFTALPNGFRSSDIAYGFKEIQNTSVLWYSTQENANSAFINVLYYNANSYTKTSHNKTEGIGVRCIKN